MQKREEETEGEIVVMTWVKGMEKMRLEDCEKALLSLLSNREHSRYQVMCSWGKLSDLAERLCAKASPPDLQPAKPLSQICSQRISPISLFAFVSPTDFSTLNLPSDVFLTVKTSQETSVFTVHSYTRRCTEMGLSSFQSAAPNKELISVAVDPLPEKQPLSATVDIVPDEELFSNYESFRLPLKSRSQPPAHSTEVEQAQEKQAEESSRKSLEPLQESEPDRGTTIWPVEVGLYRDLDKGQERQFYVVVRVIWVGDWKWAKLCLTQVQTESIYVLLGETFTFIPVSIDPVQPVRVRICADSDGSPLSREVHCASLLDIPVVEAGTSLEEFQTQQKGLRADLAQHGNSIETWKAARRIEWR